MMILASFFAAYIGCVAAVLSIALFNVWREGRG